ncbi:MAG: hypothetical protein GY715_00175, partial [Planctomycetes bacterium]|nr:hypothetical protein [Planctomycetota bacterium]
MMRCIHVIALRVIAATVCSIMIATAVGAAPRDVAPPRDLSARIDAL